MTLITYYNLPTIIEYSLVFLGTNSIVKRIYFTIKMFYGHNKKKKKLFSY